MSDTTALVCTTDPDRAPRFRGLTQGRQGPVRIRVGMLRDDSCYGCQGTGYLSGFGSHPGTPCLHHSPDCEPEGCCLVGCEFMAEMEQDDNGLEFCSAHGYDHVGYTFDGTTHTHAVCTVDGCPSVSLLAPAEDDEQPRTYRDYPFSLVVRGEGLSATIECPICGSHITAYVVPIHWECAHPAQAAHLRTVEHDPAALDAWATAGFPVP